MSAWLYQMSVDYWRHERYRADVWQGADTTWDVGKIVPAEATPQAGDIIVLYYVEAEKGVKPAERDPGIYGWGIVLWYEDKEIRYRPTSPSDYLKVNPLWNDEVNKLVDDIRGRMKQGTMWKISDKHLRDIRALVAKHASGVL